jgi:AraC-like DNA-binding protein
MRGRTTSTKARSSGKGGASHLTILNPTTPPPPSTTSLPSDPLLQSKYRKLIHKQLDRHLDKLFAEFTGLHFHITWAPLPPHEWDTLSLPTACSVCCRLSGAPLLKDCWTCGPKQLARALSADGDGHHFTCRLGVLNYWFPIRVRGATLGIAYLQALDRRPPPKTVQIHCDLGPRLANGKRATLGNNRHRKDARHVSWAEFARAARLLLLIVQHVQTASLADLRKADLTNAGRAVLALEKEQTRLHRTLQRHLPPTSQVPRGSGPESHTDQIVHRVLKGIEVDYGKPVTLQQYARELGMNAAYLSGLFSHALGVPFKTYLTEVRMTKAKGLLEDQAKTASDVAFAVGYASENRFRLAFKKATGLSPKFWRETMQTNPPPPPP